MFSTKIVEKIRTHVECLMSFSQKS